tara:strand:- start:870 stop:1091 length:222 start_codon:yes stop_codon:yes gene_type:complete
MDLVATACDAVGLYRLSVQSVHGALWIQTHFPSQEWETLLRGEASFGNDCINMLMEDASAAGLSIKHLSAVES